MITTLPFMSGNSQAIRLPKAFAFAPNVPVVIHKEDNKLIIEPVPTLANAPELFKKLGEFANQNDFVRDELVENDRAW